MLLPILRQIEQKTLVERSARGLRAAAGVSFGRVGIFPEFVRSNHTGGRRRRLRLPLMLSMGKLGQGELPHKQLRKPWRPAWNLGQHVFERPAQ